ncbi:MAG: GYF domain-containing protein, partial [Verrucomicrobiota bacterium]|nr:GYF domain-containing protein [Verrucomicrobiota bacterium]
MQIHVDRSGQRFGPYSLEDVNRYLADGTLLPSDIGWHEGAADWMPLTKIAGVVAGGGPPGPPAPTAADAAGASGPPAAPTAADAAKPKAPEMVGAGAPASKGKGGAAIKIVAIVLLIAGLGAGGYFFIYPKYFAKGGSAAKHCTQRNIFPQQRATAIGRLHFHSRPCMDFTQTIHEADGLHHIKHR